jgi:hypothetical protein
MHKKFKDCESFIQKANSDNRPYIIATTTDPIKDDEGASVNIEMCMGNFENLNKQIIGFIVKMLINAADIDISELIAMLSDNTNESLKQLLNYKNISLN